MRETDRSRRMFELQNSKLTSAFVMQNWAVCWSYLPYVPPFSQRWWPLALNTLFTHIFPFFPFPIPYSFFSICPLFTRFFFFLFCDIHMYILEHLLLFLFYLNMFKLIDSITVSCA